MAIELQIGTEVFEYPDAGEASGWGENATSWAQAVTNQLNTLLSANDIPVTTVSISNNIVAPQNILGLAFNLSAVIQCEIHYFIKRVAGLTTLVEEGVIRGTYDGAEFSLTQDTTGDAGVQFSVTAGGQFQYISTNFVGQTTGTMIFKASTFAL